MYYSHTRPHVWPKRSWYKGVHYKAIIVMVPALARIKRFKVAFNCLKARSCDKGQLKETGLTIKKKFKLNVASRISLSHKYKRLKWLMHAGKLLRCKSIKRVLAQRNYALIQLRINFL